MGKKQTAYTPSILPVLIKLYFLPIKEQLTVHIDLNTVLSSGHKFQGSIYSVNNTSRYSLGIYKESSLKSLVQNSEQYTNLQPEFLLD